ncbi:VOC family protein [Agrobacterium sp. NPDC089420]|uniref:VOC family protein n=1 Tax=Agrobacterium sp. NPDC089420 TaxID=3363918 RepID=UPI00384F7DC8
MLEGLHFQNAYVTHNVEQTLDTFRQRAAVRKIIQFETETAVSTPQGAGFQHTKLAFVWVGNLQYELIQPIGGAVDIYRQGLSQNDRPAFHHICMRIGEWNDFRRRVDRQSLPVVLEGGGDALKFLYLDARELVGHYLEYVWMSEERWRQLGGE